MEIIKDSNISFHCQDTLNSVLEPILFNVSPINYFIYIRLYDDGTSFSLPSNVDWHKWFIANGYHNKTNKQRAQVGNTFWSSQKMLNEAQREGAELFAIDNRLDIVERNDDGFHEIFGFGGVRENTLEFYINNLLHADLFKDFFLRHPDIRKLISHGETDRFAPSSVYLAEEAVKKPTKRIIGGVAFSLKEWQVATHYIRGRSVKFIAQKINTTSASVNETLRRVRDKIGASNRDDCIDFAECSGWLSPTD